MHVGQRLMGSSVSPADCSLGTASFIGPFKDLFGIILVKSWTIVALTILLEMYEKV